MKTIWRNIRIKLKKLIYQSWISLPKNINNENFIYFGLKALLFFQIFL